MGRTYIEAFFRHKFILVLPVVLCFVVGAGMAFSAPREYVAGLSLGRYPCPGHLDRRHQPAVAAVGGSGHTAHAAAGDAHLHEIGRRGQPAREGVQAGRSDGRRRHPRRGPCQCDDRDARAWLMTLSVVRHDGDEAIGIAKAIVEQYDHALVDAAMERAQAQVDYDRTQFEIAQRALKASDTEATRAALTAAAGALNESNANLAVASSQGVRVVDEPDIAYPQARKKGIIFGAAGGMIAGLTLSLLALIFIMARDNSLRGDEEAVAAGLDIGGSIPAFGRRERDALHV